MAYRYAQRTKVPANQTKNEIEAFLMKQGASGFISGTVNTTSGGSSSSTAMLAFEMRDRRIKFVVPMPTGEKGWRSATENQLAAETRRRWRALLLVIKAKLEAVNSQIVSFDVEFMPFIVLPTGKTVAENIVPQLPELLAGKDLPPLLGAGS